MSIHTLTLPDTDSQKYLEARFHYLLQIVFGETVAINYCRLMADFAPTEDARKFLLQQQDEEVRHLEILTEYLSSHPRPEAKISPYLRKVDAVMFDAIKRKDYIDSIFIQNFIVEGLNVSLLRELEHHADGKLSEICTTILLDEVGHMDFGVQELRRILVESNYNKKIIKHLIWLQRKTLLPATFLALDIGKESHYLGIPIREFAQKTVDEHFKRIQDAGLPLPYIDRLLFKGVIIFLRTFA